MTALINLQKQLRVFTHSRDWEQFHTPKNLAVAIAVEVAELLEIFQWLSDAQASQITKSKKDMARIEEEIADVFIYVLRFADVLGVDLERISARKIAKNARKYPIRTAKGNAIKYARRRR
jgi:NTP pyrophosphatase (non-canonical NTP hydrolase)